MNKDWLTSKLRCVADVRVSNVDKKFYATETPVKLCNYMDVYANDYVTAAIEFMTASASKAEIERFGLMAGDVVITKDSETPDDIGVSAVIAEQISGLVCGYHLALIRPRKGEIDPIYLAKQLCSWPSIKYFAANASGSTRFGLSISAIESLEIPLAPSPEQTKIGEVLSTVDRAIEQTEALVAKQQRIKTGLTQDLLTRGIDKAGTLRSEQTHEFKDSPLGRIPSTWTVRSCEQLCREIVVGIVIRPAQYYRPDGVPVLRSANVRSGWISPDDLVFMSDRDNQSLSKSRLREGDLATVRTGYPGTTAVIPAELDGCNCVDIVISRPKREAVRSAYLSLWVNSDHGRRQVLEGQGGLAQQHFNVGEMRRLLVKVPELSEQEQIEHTIRPHDNALQAIKRQSMKLRLLKTGLMQDLLTGHRRVTSLIAEPEVATP